VTAPSRRERAVLVSVALATLLAPLNSTMIAVALPAIVDDFDTTVGTAGWLVTSYLLALAAVQPVAGKLGDRHGRRPFVIGGLAVFGLASLGAALAPSLGVLIFFRVAQAVSGAVVFPNGAGLIRELVPATRRGGAFGLVSAGIAVAAGLGPLIGGLLVSVGGWSAIFLVNVPVVGVALVLAWVAVPRRRPVVPASPFDWLGSVLLVTVLAGAAAVVLEGRDAPTSLVVGVPALVVLAIVFLRRELSHPDPVLQPRFFGVRAFAAANAGIATSNLAFYTVLLVAPLLLTRIHGWTSFETGVALAVLSAPMVVFSPIGGRLADRLGRRAPTVTGCAILAIGLVPPAIEPGLDTTALLVCLGLMGTGVGLLFAGMQAAAIEALDAKHAGVAAGIFSTSRYVGSFAGSVVLASVLADDRSDGFQVVFAMALVAALASVVVSLGLPARRPTRVRFATPEREAL
jgi:EmrB/QacA subfamily drug resistance transporter